MLKILRIFRVWKLNRLICKRDKAFMKGNYEAAAEYGKKVDVCIIETLNEEYGL